MGLFPYQEDIVNRIHRAKMLSLAAPRQNGKTFAALTAAVQSELDVIHFASGYASARYAYETAAKIAEAEGRPISKRSHSNSNIAVEFEGGGGIKFLSYNKNGARGLHAAMLILDDADCASPELLAQILPTLTLAKRKTRIVSISVAPDDGIAKKLWDVSDDQIRYASESVEHANPALGNLFDLKAIEFERMCLPVECYRRERLGLVP